eukprot:TRINITY_DN24292_c0_g1_i1.p1 TRINITY_DN24292_c0_g1~~TRINITY_DN24292_c0_g1_i1.p1  ORF type:complete len:300 (-),score=36.39 TRINITY_DN24292_c0_g1_i1:154-1008(-)
MATVLQSAFRPSVVLKRQRPSHSLEGTSPNFHPHSVKYHGKSYIISQCSEAKDGTAGEESRPTRRDACVALLGSSLCLLNARGEEALAASAVSVGSYLPKAGEGDLVVFTPGDKSTPALRAGNVSPYSFFLPPSWTQARIANILSGNYCQPKCAEPWIEVKFEDPKQGTLLVVASPMVRLTNKPNAKIEEIGPPEKLIAALGPFVTGDSYDPDEVVETSIRSVDGQTYYDYALETPFARSGAHNLAVATAKGSTVLLLVVSANDSQWSANKGTLRKLADSFCVL